MKVFDFSSFEVSIQRPNYENIKYSLRFKISVTVLNSFFFQNLVQNCDTYFGSEYMVV